MSKKNEPHLDVTLIIKHLGGRSRIPGALREQGLMRVSEYQIDKWMQRNSIPMRALAHLMILAKRERRPISLYKCLREPEKCPK